MSLPRLPILLLPGLGCTAEIWSAQLPQLWGRGPVTIADHTGGDSIAAIAAAILATAPPRFALAGISMGGYLAFEIWRQARARVLGLALVDTSARPDTPEATERRRAAIALAEAGRFELALSQSFPTAVHPDHVQDAALKALHLRMNRATGVPAWRRQQQAIIGRVDSRPDLPGIDVPSLVLVGDADALTPPELSHEMAAALPDGQLVTIPQAGHLALAEQPETTTAALLAWLHRVAAKPGI